MNVNAVLNADMTTVKAWLQAGFQWWVGQLRELVPTGLQMRTGGNKTIALFDGESGFSYLRAGKTIAKPAQAEPRVTLAIPEHLSLRRTLSVPRIGMADIRRLVDLEIERLMPLPRDETLVAVVPDRGGDDPKALSVAVAMLPRTIAERVLVAASDARIVPTAFSLSSASREGLRFDFAPELREQGMLPARRSPTALWWALVGMVFALNLIVLIIRDHQAVDRIETLVEEQAPAVSAARTVASRARTFETNAHILAERRLSHNALAALAAVSDALPAGAWVQRYSWSGRTLRLTGYKRSDVDVLAALRRSPAFANVRPSNSDVIAEIPAGQPFDIMLTLRPLAR